MTARRWSLWDGPWIGLALVLLTATARLIGIADPSITQDESTMLLFAQGVLERGYPFLRQAHEDFVISTYELVPYPIALSIGLLGTSEFALRLPAVAFACVTSVLVLRFGTTLFERRVGVLAALMFALLPWCIYWGSNAFYPSQVTLAALWATMALHRVTVVDAPAPRDYYAVLASVTFMYLSWEGSAALLPALFALLIVFRWGRWQWVRSVHAWNAFLGVLLVVLGQLAWRTVLRAPYEGVVTGRSEVSLSTLAAGSTAFDAAYYAVNLNSEAHLVLAVCLLLGLCWLKRARGLRVLYLLLALYLTVLTTLLGYYALRYVFLAAPAALLVAAAVLVLAADAFADGRRRVSAVALAGLASLHLAIGTPWGLRPVRASPDFESTARPNELRLDLQGFPFRRMANLLESLYRPGDRIIVQAPFPFQAYTGRSGDYFLQEVTVTSVFMQPDALPYYTDKWAGNPVLRNQTEVDQVLADNDRVWFVAAPDGAALQSAGAPLYAGLTARMRLVGETQDGRLYLWENPRVRTIRQEPPALP